MCSRHDMSEILLKLALSTNQSIHYWLIWNVLKDFSLKCIWENNTWVHLFSFIIWDFNLCVQCHWWLTTHVNKTIYVNEITLLYILFQKKIYFIAFIFESQFLVYCLLWSENKMYLYQRLVPMVIDLDMYFLFYRMLVNSNTSC